MLEVGESSIRSFQADSPGHKFHGNVMVEVKPEG
jgi:hypothetical protein